MKKIFPLFFIILFFLNCQYFNLMTYKEWLEINKDNLETNVYSAGYYSAAGATTACYWKNEELFSLEKGYSVSALSGASSIYVIDDNIYVGGSIEAPGPVSNACYWVNGKLQTIQLNNPTFESAVTSIFVINGAVFMAGYEDIAGIDTACYWIADIKYSLYIPLPASPSRANSIYVVQDSSSKHRAYIAGTLDFGGANPEACYWSENGENIIRSGILSSEAHSIFIYGNKVYTAGELSTGPPDQICYWGNNSLEFTTPAGGAGECFDSRILISANGDIHFASSTSGPNVYYWKNMELKYQFSLDNRQIRSFDIYDNDVYFGGTDGGNDAAYWINNGNPINVDNGGGATSWINSIFVTVNKHK